MESINTDQNLVWSQPGVFPMQPPGASDQDRVLQPIASKELDPKVKMVFWRLFFDFERQRVLLVLAVDLTYLGNIHVHVLTSSESSILDFAKAKYSFGPLSPRMACSRFSCTERPAS